MTMKDIFNFFEKPRITLVSAIRISLASPEKIRSGRTRGEEARDINTAPSSPSATASSAQRSLGR